MTTFKAFLGLKIGGGSGYSEKAGREPTFMTKPGQIINGSTPSIQAEIAKRLRSVGSTFLVFLTPMRPI